MKFEYNTAGSPGLYAFSYEKQVNIGSDKMFPLSIISFESYNRLAFPIALRMSSKPDYVLCIGLTSSLAQGNWGSPLSTTPRINYYYYTNNGILPVGAKTLNEENDIIYYAGSSLLYVCYVQADTSDP
jgi:hypothetical protein